LREEEDSLLKPGSTAPDFELASVDGGRIRLSNYRGKAVWLCFWRIGCPPCIENMPHLQEVYAKFKDRGLVILGIDCADDRQITIDYLRKTRVTFPNILDSSSAGEKVCYETYGRGALPMYYLINADGIIVDAWYGDSSKTHEREKAALRKLRPEWAEALP
jgi:peroxiredoxin